MTRGDTAILSIIQIAMIHWLRAHRWLMRAVWVCVPFTWVFAVASYWEDGSWPQFDGVMLFLTLSSPLLFVPAISLLFRRALDDLEGPLGLLAAKVILVGVPLTLVVLGVDALILLAAGRHWLMSGQFLPRV